MNLNIKKLLTKKTQRIYRILNKSVAADGNEKSWPNSYWNKRPDCIWVPARINSVKSLENMRPVHIMDRKITILMSAYPWWCSFEVERNCLGFQLSILLFLHLLFINSRLPSKYLVALSFVCSEVSILNEVRNLMRKWDEIIFSPSFLISFVLR